MNRTELVKEVLKHMPVGISERVVEETLKLAFELIREVTHDEPVKIRGFWTFKMKRRAARVGRNPQNGEAVAIPERLTLVFKEGAMNRART